MPSKYEQTYRRAVASVENTWGRQVRDNVGPVVYRSLVSERVLVELAMQDDSIDPATIVDMLSGVYALVCEYHS